VSAAAAKTRVALAAAVELAPVCLDGVFFVPLAVSSRRPAISRTGGWLWSRRRSAELKPGRLVVEPVGGGGHEDGYAAAGGDETFGDLVAGRSGYVSVEDGDVVGVDAYEVEGGLAVTRGVRGDGFQTEPVADGFGQVGLVFDNQDTHTHREASTRHISSLYPKPHTFWQQAAALTSNRDLPRTNNSPKSRTVDKL
jgi:hypothetical protein